MNAVEAERELIKLLHARLKECARMTIAYHGVLMNFPEEVQAQLKETMNSYRESEPVRQKVEEQFRDLDSLIEKVDAGLDAEELHKLLQLFDPSGKLPN